MWAVHGHSASWDSATLSPGCRLPWFIRERVPIGPTPFLDLAMFRHLPLTAVFCAGAVGAPCRMDRANGAFFTIYPVVVASTAAGMQASGGNSGSAPAVVAMRMAITGWTGGYLKGVPIAGYLLEALGVGGSDRAKVPTQSGRSIDPYRAAIFYAGGVALAAAGFALVARLKMGQRGKEEDVNDYLKLSLWCLRVS